MTASVAILVALAVVGVASSIRRPLGSRPLPRRPDATAPEPAWNHLTRRLALDDVRRRRPPAPRAVADWCDDLARTIRSGSTFHDALRTVVPADVATARETNSVRHRLERGAAIADAVELTDGGAHLQLAVGVFAIAGRLGGSPAVAVERTAAALRQRGADRDERSVQAAQARLSAHVLTALPVAMLALLCIVDRDVTTAVRTPTGATSIVVGIAINALGWWWMHRIVRGSE